MCASCLTEDLPTSDASGALRPSRFAGKAVEVAFAAGIMALVSAVYFSNRFCLIVGDAQASGLTALQLARAGGISLRPKDHPEVFVWSLGASPDGERDYLSITELDDALLGMIAAGELQEQGNGDRAVASPTRHLGKSVGTFGWAPAAGAAPVFAARQWLEIRHADDVAEGWWGGKAAAALYTAGAAAGLFLAARRHLRRGSACALALIFAFGTTAWSTSSQALFQHGPNEFFLVLGALALSSDVVSHRRAALGGTALGLAFCCRPSSIAALVVFAAWLAWRNRRAALAFAAGSSPWLVLTAGHNWHWFGAPWLFGQSLLNEVAYATSGSTNVWSTPLWKGVLANLFSPSRGLFVYSPFFAFSVWGAVVIWRQRAWRQHRVLLVAVIAVWAIECRHFDWWSGWSWCYRHIGDTAGYLCLLLIPVWVRIFHHRALAGAFVATVLWSIGAQAMGAYLFDLGGWNSRVGFVCADESDDEPALTTDLDRAVDWLAETSHRIAVVRQNVDELAWRHRLWNVHDSQLAYYATNPAPALATRAAIRSVLDSTRDRRLAESHTQVGRAWLRLEQPRRAQGHFETALRYRADCLDAQLGKIDTLLAADEPATGGPFVVAELSRSRDLPPWHRGALIAHGLWLHVAQDNSTELKRLLAQVDRSTAGAASLYFERLAEKPPTPAGASNQPLRLELLEECVRRFDEQLPEGLIAWYRQLSPSEQAAMFRVANLPGGPYVEDLLQALERQRDRRARQAGASASR